MLNKLVREPLIHFLLIAGLIFVIYDWMNPNEENSDGIIVVSSGRIDQLNELFEKVGPHYYDRIDVTMTAESRAQVEDRLRFLEPTEVAGVPVTGIDRVDGLRFTLEGGGWALIRLSGTEPLMRIYTEVGSEQLVKPVLDSVRELTGV